MKGSAGTTSIKSQDGSVLVIALLILVFLTLIGISASTITQIEIQVAGNERAYNIAFNTSDSGVYTTPKVVRRTVEEGARPTLAAITYLPSDDGSFFREVMGYNAHDTAKDMSFTLSGQTVSVDVDRDKQISVGGGGVEFGSGAEGVGVGSAGGVAIIYALDSAGTGPNNASTNIGAEYRLLPGVAGGL
jgi:Tfp pilus assembly protein PilX